MDFESVLVTLKVISALTYGDRLTFQYGEAIIQKPSWFVSIQRLLYRDSRLNTLHCLDALITDLDRLVDKLYRDNDMAARERLYDNIYEIVHDYNRGINALKITYAADDNCVANLKNLIERIHLVLCKLKSSPDTIQQTIDDNEGGDN
jgi:hypothetical protein